MRGIASLLAAEVHRRVAAAIACAGRFVVRLALKALLPRPGSSWLVRPSFPGQPPELLEPGQAKLIKAGSDLVLEIHYTTNGTASIDRSKFGLVFAKEPPRERVLTLSATNGKFKIPPRHPNYRVDAAFELHTAVKLSGLHPHMHGRGKDFEYRIVYPAGETETLLRVPRYDWHWQLWYTLASPIVLPKGSKIECTAHFDNSPNNPDNADPAKEVVWGDQSWDEMMVGFFNLVFDAKMPVKDIFVERTGTPAENLKKVAAIR